MSALYWLTIVLFELAAVANGIGYFKTRRTLHLFTAICFLIAAVLFTIGAIVRTS